MLLRHLPPNGEYDGEQWHQFEIVLVEVGRHDRQLQEVEEVEAQRVIDVVAVGRHLLALQ